MNTISVLEYTAITHSGCVTRAPPHWHVTAHHHAHYPLPLRLHSCRSRVAIAVHSHSIDYDYVAVVDALLGTAYYARDCVCRDSGVDSLTLTALQLWMHFSNTSHLKHDIVHCHGLPAIYGAANTSRILAPAPVSPSTVPICATRACNGCTAATC